MIRLEEVPSERPAHGPRCGVTPAGHRWTLSVNVGELVLTSGCEECDDHVLGICGVEVLDMDELPGRLTPEQDHPNLGGWHGDDRCDCNAWWQFRPDGGAP